MATRRALDNDLPDAPVMEPGVAVCTGITAAPALVCTGVACGVTVAVLARAAGLATAADGCDGFTPSAVRPFCDNARRLSNAAARDERGVAVLFSIASFMLLSFRIQQTLTRVNSCEGHLLDSLSTWPTCLTTAKHYKGATLTLRVIVITNQAHVIIRMCTMARFQFGNDDVNRLFAEHR